MSNNQKTIKNEVRRLLQQLLHSFPNLIYNVLSNLSGKRQLAGKPTVWRLTMNEDLVILNSYLTELGVAPRIKTLNDRIRVQKGIYLAQAAGADLGYDYNWYLHGPYSPELANDYYKLSEAIFMNKIPPATEQSPTTNGPKLKDSYVTTLRSLAAIISPPQDFDRTQEDWLELVSSLHFLQTKKSLNLEAARHIIEKQKAHLVQYVDQAQEKLREVNLLRSPIANAPS